MRSNEQRIHDALTEHLAPEFFQLENESHRHSRPGVDTHFKVTLVSRVFTEMPLLERHRKVNALCSEAFKNGLHALSLHLYTPDEWAKSGTAAPHSPACRNQV